MINEFWKDKGVLRDLGRGAGLELPTTQEPGTICPDCREAELEPEFRDELNELATVAGCPACGAGFPTQEGLDLHPNI